VGRAVEIDVIIPLLRPDLIASLLRSFSQNTVKPDLVTLVSNEVQSVIQAYDLKVRILRFESSEYPIGNLDVALRRNVGIWNSPCSHIITFDDDQLAPLDLIQTSREILERHEHFWGHYRYLDFSKYSLDTILRLPPSRGRPRENPPCGWHLYLSAYGGLFGANRRWLQTQGGYDMIFCGRHGGEDQNLGRRLSRFLGYREKIFIYEPPFAWHPESRIPWSAPGRTNLCRSEHHLENVRIRGVIVAKCCRCPYFTPPSDLQSLKEVIIPFDPAKVNVQAEETRSRQKEGVITAP
jgi:hypothetical protein